MLRPRLAIKTRQYDLLRPGQKKPPRLGCTICYGVTWTRTSHQGSAVRFVTAKRGPEGAIKTRQYDLLRPRVGQKEPPRLGSTMCYGETWARKNHQDSAVRFVTAKRGPERATETRQYDLLRQTWARKSHRDSAVQFDTAKRVPERATKTRQYDLLRPRIVQKEQPRLGSTIRYGKEFGSTICYGQELTRKSHQDSAVRFGTANHGPERATKTRQYDLLRPRVGQKEPPRLGTTICCGQTCARKSHQDSAVRFVEPSRLSRKSRQDSAIRFVTAKSWQERATENRQYDL